MWSCSLRILVHNLTPSRSLSTSREYVVLLSSHPRPQSDTITLPLHLQEVRCSVPFVSAFTISRHHVPPPPGSTLSCSLGICVHNVMPTCSLCTPSWYAILLPLHPRLQCHTITLSRYFQEVRCPAPFVSTSTISLHHAPSLHSEGMLSYSTI